MDRLTIPSKVNGRNKESRGSLLIHFNFNEKHLLGVEVAAKILSSPIQNRFLGYSVRIPSSFRQHSDQLKTLYWIIEVEFVTHHSLIPCYKPYEQAPSTKVFSRLLTTKRSQKDSRFQIPARKELRAFPWTLFIYCPSGGSGNTISLPLGIFVTSLIHGLFSMTHSMSRGSVRP